MLCKINLKKLQRRNCYLITNALDTKLYFYVLSCKIVGILGVFFLGGGQKMAKMRDIFKFSLIMKVTMSMTINSGFQ